MLCRAAATSTCPAATPNAAVLANHRPAPDKNCLVGHRPLATVLWLDQHGPGDEEGAAAHVRDVH